MCVYVIVRTVSSCVYLTMLHPEYAKRGVGHWCIERGCNSQRKHGACIARINNAIIPETGGAIVGIALGLVLVENGLFESGLFLLAHTFATGGQPFLAHCCQYTGIGNRHDHFRSVFGYAALFVLATYHEAGNILQEDQRCQPLRTELNEMCSFQ